LTLHDLLNRMEAGVQERHLVGGDDRFAEDQADWIPPASAAESALAQVLRNRTTGQPPDTAE
jgi:hypothetical protein